MCGKDMQLRMMMSGSQGSPPHVRERLSYSSNGFKPIGITPACAGKTSSEWEGAGRCGDHPRMCGKDVPSK